MSRDEILAMKPGVELDGAVASKVMGWHIVEGHMTGRLFWHDTDGVSHGVIYDFKPSTDIADAWKVVEKSEGYCEVNRRHRATGWGEPGEWYWNAAFARDGQSYWAHADTAPEAICKAAYLAVTP